ncbi:MAG: hypothetical protein IT385_01740 [Deltaproteobacteria bacterium]|nr:hypothetical protein [Deltaproteobacteria bacterium]
MKTTTKTLLWTLLMGLVTTATTASARPPYQPPPIDVDEPGDLLRDPGLGGALTGSIEISNERHRPMKVFVDGRFALEVGARATAIIPDVPNGVRLVAYGDRRGAFEVDRVEVRIDRRAALRIAPLRGVAVIRNESGVPMRVRFGDDDLGVVQPGRELESAPLLSGVYTLSYVPQGRGIAPRTERVTLEAGERTRIALAPFFAELVVRNPFPFDVNLFLDGKRVGKIDGRDELRLDALVPARVDAQLRKQGKVLAGATLDLDAGRLVRWDPPGPRFGDLEVVNPTRFPVRVQIGSMTGFVLRPGETRHFNNLDAGPTNIQVTLEDGRVVRHVLTIEGGERERFEVPRSQGDGVHQPAPVRPF